MADPVWNLGWSADRCALAALAAYEPGSVDELCRGFADANVVAGNERVRELALERQAWAWSPERLAGFLLQHEAYMRSRRCTCCRCPLHDDIDAPPRPNAN